jgi:hypothetical protein
MGLFVSFIGWLIIKPDQINTYIANPIYGSGIVISLCLVVFFASRLRHCSVSKNAFIFILPFIFFDGVLTILNKTAMDSAELHQNVWFYMMLQGFGIACVVAIKEKIKRKNIKHLFDKKLIKAGLCICLFGLMGGGLKGYALYAVDNPAYVVAIVMLSPFWIICIYKIIGRKEQGVDIISGLFLVLSVIALVLFKGMM